VTPGSDVMRVAYAISRRLTLQRRSATTAQTRSVARNFTASIF